MTASRIFAPIATVRGRVRRGTPPDLIARVQRDATHVLTQADTRARLTKMGVDLTLNSPDEFRAYLQSEIARYTRIVKTAGLRAE